MKRTLLSLIMLLSLPAAAGVRAACTLPWIGSVIGEIGGNKVEVTTLVSPDEDPHYAEPRPSMLLAVRKADLLFYNGLDLEVGYLPRIIESSNNPKIQPGKAGNIDLSQFVSVIEKPSTVDRSMGDIHPLGNPHYSFSPKNMGKVAEGMARVLSSADPSNSAYYNASLKSFLDRLAKKQKEWGNSGLSGKRVIAYHKLFEYMADEYGFRIVAYIEPKPGIPPSAKHLGELLGELKTGGGDVIISTTVQGTKEAEYLSKNSGIRAREVAQDVGGTSDTKDWFSMIDSMVSAVRGN